jgi:hypothetical protein
MRFAIVLFSALLLAVGQPLVGGMVDEQGTFDVAVSLLIMAVMLLAFEQRDHRKLGLLLGLAAFVGLWVSHAVHESTGVRRLTRSWELCAVTSSWD